MSAPRVSRSLPRIYQQQFNRLQNPAVADFMRPALTKTHAVTHGYALELMDRQIDLAFRLDSLDRALVADRLPVLASCRKILPIAAAYNTEGLLSIVQSDQRTFQRRTGLLAAQCAQLSRGEITDLAQNNPEVSLPVLWQLLNNHNIKDLVYRNAVSHIQGLKTAGIDIERMMNLNDPAHVRSVYEQAMALGPIQKIVPQAITDMTGRTKRDIESDHSLFTVYADEIAQALGNSLLKKAGDFSVGAKKAHTYLSLVEGLEFRKGKGVEFVLSPRNLKEFHAGKLSGDCTANGSPFENIGAGVNFHLVPTWISDQTHFILLQYYNNEFFAKYNLAVCRDSENGHHLFLHAAERAVVMPDTCPDDREEYMSIGDVFSHGASRIMSLARSGNILSVPASMVTNEDLYDHMGEALRRTYRPLQLVAKADEGALPILFSKRYSEVGTMDQAIQNNLQWNGFDEGVDEYNELDNNRILGDINTKSREEQIRQVLIEERLDIPIIARFVNVLSMGIKADYTTRIASLADEINNNVLSAMTRCLERISALLSKRGTIVPDDEPSEDEIVIACDKAADNLETEEQMRARIEAAGCPAETAAEIAKTYTEEFQAAMKESYGDLYLSFFANPS